MKSLARDLRAAELTHFMFLANEQETGYTDLGPENEIEDLSLECPFLALPKWLEKRAAMYEAWLHLASQKIPPKDFGTARLARLCVALYVQYATGRNYFTQVSKLVESMGIGFGGDFKTTQLSREVNEFEIGHSWCRGFLKSQFELLDPEPRNRNSGVIGAVSDASLKSGKRVDHRATTASTHVAKSAGSSCKHPKVRTAN
jgi:hypothetical protein